MKKLAIRFPEMEITEQDERKRDLERREKLYKRLQDAKNKIKRCKELNEMYLEIYGEYDSSLNDDIEDLESEIRSIRRKIRNE